MYAIRSYYDPKNVPINKRHALHPPVVRMSGKQGIDLIQVQTNPGNQLFAVIERFFADIKIPAKGIDVPCYIFRGTGAPLKIMTK